LSLTFPVFSTLLEGQKEHTPEGARSVKICLYSPSDAAGEGTVPETETDNEILDSWKEIAVFLRRGLRTVQRWERTEGLPVRRHSHLKRSSVYALRSDIVLWMRTRQFGQNSRVNKYPLHQCSELRAHVAQQRIILNQLRAELQIRWATVMSSWKQLQQSAVQAKGRGPLVEELAAASPPKSGTARADISQVRRASA